MRQSHSDRRMFARQSVSLPCRVDGVTTQEPLRITDVSAGGCFVAAHDPMTVSQEVTIHAKFAGVELSLVGRVVHVQRGRGFAIEFGNLATDTRYLLDQFLTRAPIPNY